MTSVPPSNATTPPAIPSTDLDHALCRTLQEWLHDTEDHEAGAGIYARRLLDLYDAGSGLEALECYCWDLWKACSQAVEKAPQDAPCAYIDKLVRLLKAIKESEPLRDGDGKIIIFWGGECWKDLPLLGPAMREKQDSSRTSDQTELALRVNEAIFAARLTQSQVFDLSLHGLWALREALEGETPWCPAGPLEYTIPIAHAWIMHAGDILVKLDDNRGRVAKGGSLWTGQSGFCRVRWLLWKQRFKDLSTDNQLKVKARELAKEATDRMEEILIATKHQ